MKRNLSLILVLACLLSGEAFAQGKTLVPIGSALDAYIDDIQFYGLQMHSVVVDMDLYIGWDTTNKEGMKAASTVALKRIDGLVEEVRRLKSPEETLFLKEAFFRTAARYRALYKDLDQKEISSVQKESIEILNQNASESKKAGEAFDFTPLAEILEKARDFPMTEIGTDVSVKSLEESLSKKYSPLFFEAFVRWRTLTQEAEHGLSNWSGIPNWDYNLKRKELIDKLRVYLRENPKDLRARTQVAGLVNMENINRGGAYGNETLNYMGTLYMDLEKEK